MNQVSYKQRVIELAKKNPAGITTKDVKREVKGIAPTTMYALLWTMKKAGTLVHDREANVYTLANISTPVYKSAETEAKPEPRNKEVGRTEEAALMLRNQELRHQLENATAVIRYLEDKLFKAIQFGARNGGNS